MKNKPIIIATIAILVLILIGAIVLLSQKNTPDERTYCTAESRNAEVCIELYAPVCGFPGKMTYSNSCFACMNNAVEYYIPGECL